jgi:nitrate reductase molybdenum cofactor assembly chaperone
VTTALAQALARAGTLLTYPSGDYARDLPALIVHVRSCDPAAADALEAFEAHVGGASNERLQELFTQAFDLNPVCALEVGWQLFGEEYERGAFMVQMRQLLRDHDVAERGELPDHLSSLLSLLPRLECDPARAFAADALIPAVDKMLAAMEKADSPFRPLLQAIGRLLATGAASPVEVVHA